VRIALFLRRGIARAQQQVVLAVGETVVQPLHDLGNQRVGEQGTIAAMTPLRLRPARAPSGWGDKPVLRTTARPARASLAAP
jgi:hypothetical protein